MLELTIENTEYWDNVNNIFCTLPEKKFHFEHSLASISKWEMKWKIPYMATENKTAEQAMDYIRFMCFEEIDDLYLAIVASRYEKEINEYMNDPMTATRIKETGMPSQSRNNITTNEEIYHMMTVHNIPFECENWHFNRLLTLIRVCNEKSKDPKKMTQKETLEHYRELNQARRAQSKARH